LAALGLFAVALGILLTWGSGPLLVTSFPQARKLITNERAYFSPHSPGVHLSRAWLVTSGSLFSDSGAGWTGVPDDVPPNKISSNGTDSAVFRAVTRRADFTDVTVSFQLKVAGLVSTQRTPAVPYDGVHVFLRYQNPQHLYVVSVYRRDGIVAIKEKLPGGSANGGSYYTLAEARHQMPLHAWVPVSVTIETEGRAVQIQLDIGAHQVLSLANRDTPVLPILGPGRVGLRGDNCEFYFRNFTVSPAA
jgi:hypothetical protein